MGQFAYDSLVSEFIWVGIHPIHAVRLAGLQYPDEAIVLKEGDEGSEAYAEEVMDFNHHKFDEFKVNEDAYGFQGIMADIRKRREYIRVRIYIDGANLLRSYAFMKTEKSTDEHLTHETSIKIENYRKPFFDENYPVWYILLTIMAFPTFEHTLIDKITFVMCADDEGTNKLLKKIEHEYGFEVISPSKTGTGLKSSANEDKVLKDLIQEELKNDNFDIAVIGTGDGNKKDGISFPEIARKIIDAQKDVSFVGLDLSTSKAIKEHLPFFDIGTDVLFMFGNRVEE